MIDVASFKYEHRMHTGNDVFFTVFVIGASSLTKTFSKKKYPAKNHNDGSAIGRARAYADEMKNKHTLRRVIITQSLSELFDK